MRGWRGRRSVPASTAGRRSATPGQHNIVDTVPGHAHYSPLWQINKVTFKSGVTPYLLKSKAVLGFGQKGVPGFSARKTIHYYDLGPVKVAPGNAVVPLVALSNGVAGQHNITEDKIAPGATDYPRLWGIVMATWKPGAHKRLLTAFAGVKRAKAAGELTLKKSSLVVDCPLVP